MSGDIRFEVTPEKADYKSAALHNFFSPASAVGFLLTGGAIGVGASVVGGLERGLVYGFLMGLVGPISFYISQTSGASARAKLPDALCATTYVLSEAALTITAAGKTTLSKWSDWHRAIETRSVIALQPVGGLVQVFPKAQLSAHEISQIKELLSRVLAGRVKFRGET